jgi:hypothetical protein
MTQTLFSYMKAVQQMISDTRQELIAPFTLVNYINRARREVAMRSQCLRILPPISGGVETITVTAPGSGYTNPTVTVTAPDAPDGRSLYPLGAQATATATVEDGMIVNIDVTFGGSGYFQPYITITDPTGTGATAVAATSPILTLNNGQEIYNFADIPLSNFPGIGPVYGIRSVSLIYSSYRYSLPMYSFSTYQAMIRQYPNQYYYVPTMCSQFGQGASGSLYCYPLPSQQYQLEIDCYCYPQDLTTDQDVEAIPDPWTEAVPYMAAHLAYLELQNLNAAEYYRKLFDSKMPMYRNAAQPGRNTNPYGRY